MFKFNLVGLSNLGNTCYMNSCIQILLHIKTLVDNIINNINDKTRIITNALYDLYQSMFLEIDYNYISPFNFRHFLVNSHTIYKEWST